MKKKIFLSHSNLDKDYVGPIAESLGRDLCVYDSMCFEEGLQTFGEIIKNMDATCLFVFFISNASLDSPWVKRELREADFRIEDVQSSVSCIFPILIDKNINYTDERIPAHFRNGWGSYNIQHIDNYKVAERKILSQYKRILIEHNYDIRLGYSDAFFYGRKMEMALFQKQYDEGQRAKCLVVSGITGVGRRSFIVNTLRDSKIIETYYEPPTISISGDDGIIDLIMKLKEIGYGSSSLEELNRLTDKSERIRRLTVALSEIQSYKEHLIIYDNNVLIGYDGKIKQWFQEALFGIRQELTVSIAATVSPNSTLNKEIDYIGIELSTLNKAEWKGLLRTYGKKIGVCFEPEDRDYLEQIITGYPPQVIYCAELARIEGIEYVKRNGSIIVDAISENASKLLKMALESVDADSDTGIGLLSFLSNYGLTPMEILFDVLDMNEAYSVFYKRFKALSICRVIGVRGDYLEVNPVIANYIQRNKYKESPDIKRYLERKFDSFKKSIDNDSMSNSFDFESLKVLLKTSIKNGTPIKDGLLYSTIYLTAVRELYDARKYDQIIDTVNKIEEKNILDRFDIEIERQIRRYYCRALARQMKEDFYREIEWFSNNPKAGSTYDNRDYLILKAFMERLRGDYDKAVGNLKIILNRNPDDRIARKEIVSALSGMEEYDSCLRYAESNFKQDSQNKFYIKDYLEALLHIVNRNEYETNELERVMLALSGLYLSDDEKDSIYYEMQSKYAMYVEKNNDKAMELISKGIESNSDTPFLILTKFDLCERLNDLEGMGESLAQIERFLENRQEARTELAYKRRQMIYDAYKKRDYEYIYDNIERMKGVSNQYKKSLVEKIRRIAERNDNI